MCTRAWLCNWFDKEYTFDSYRRFHSYTRDFLGALVVAWHGCVREPVINHRYYYYSCSFSCQFCLSINFHLFSNIDWWFSIVGICLGMQCAVIEFSRNVLSWKDANSTEANPETTNKVVSALFLQCLYYIY